jgi:hypothetical protein
MNRFEPRHPPPGDGPVEYRVAHLHERLVAEGAADLGLRVENRGGSVVVSGSVPTAQSRETVLRLAAEELAGLDTHFDVTVVDRGVPERPERLR